MKKVIFLMVIFMHTLSFADEKVLANAVQYSSIKRDYTGTATLVIMIKGGLFREDVQNNGVGSLFSSVWFKSGKLLGESEFLGGSLNAASAADFFEFSLSAATENFDKLLAPLKTQLLSPSFNRAVFNTEKNLLLMQLEAEKDEPNTISFQNFNAASYPNHPYSLRINGTSATVEKLKFEDMQNYYDLSFHGADMTAVLVGNFTSAQEKAVIQILSAFPKGEPIKIDCSRSDIKAVSSSEDFDSRIQQAKLFLAYTAPAASSEDFAAVKLLSELLGGAMSSRYFTVLRKEKGYAYAVSSMYPSRLCSSRLIGYIGLAPENIDDAVKSMQQINKTIMQGLTEEDILKAKNHLIGALLSDIETNSRLAWYTAFFKNLGLGFNHLDAYVEQLNALSKKDLERLLLLFDKPYTLYVYKPDNHKGVEN
ncbi:MAG: insulinase family protein [Deferribacteraceae bacterium]|jgi:predicted Zn-dependent peptidase|nr:insulinase family protein [Deferribacteraceae bacterium]